MKRNLLGTNEYSEGNGTKEGFILDRTK